MGEREITPRADIYATGCVLYEMLAGEPPFTGHSAQAIVARVLTEEPRSLTLQRRTVPPYIEAAVTRALQKLPADRFASASVFAEALDHSPGFVAPARAASPATSSWRALFTPIPLAVTGVAVIAAIWGWARPVAAPVAPRYHYTLDLADDERYNN